MSLPFAIHARLRSMPLCHRNVLKKTKALHPRAKCLHKLMRGQPNQPMPEWHILSSRLEWEQGTSHMLQAGNLCCHLTASAIRLLCNTRVSENGRLQILYYGMTPC